MSDRLSSIRAVLREHGQEHLLAFHDQLDERRRESLLDQIDQIDFDGLGDLVERCVSHPAPALPPTGLQPAPYYPNRPGEAYDAGHYRRLGRDLVRAGKVAVFCVAGGQATRLGWSGPKGTYPATVVTGKPLFRVLTEQVVAHRNRSGVTIPFYIMTSPLNDADTRAFFLDNNCFGLNRRNIFMLPQGMLPTLDAATGKLMLADKGTVAMNPDGHGGSIKALADSGALEDMISRGVEHISYFQVDNPLVKVIDPLFVGLHAAAPDSSGEMSSKMVAKAGPDEKVGVFCRIDGKTTVIEYADLPEDLARQQDERGGLRFGAGSIAVHMISVRFIQALTEDPGGFRLPLHAARRKVPYVDPGSGDRVVPDAPNAVKPETFVFDALPLAGSSIIYETSRVEEFAPIKNARDADSPATSHQVQSDRAGLWLEAAGVEIPRDADGHVAASIEISPMTALEREDLARVRLPASIAPGESVVL